jgi:hypothetical protein
MQDAAGVAVRHKVKRRWTLLAKYQSDGEKNSHCDTLQLPMKNESVRQSRVISPGVAEDDNSKWIKWTLL